MDFWLDMTKDNIINLPVPEVTDGLLGYSNASDCVCSRPRAILPYNTSFRTPPGQGCGDEEKELTGTKKRRLNVSSNRGLNVLAKY